MLVLITVFWFGSGNGFGRPESARKSPDLTTKSLSIAVFFSSILSSFPPSLHPAPLPILSAPKQCFPHNSLKCNPSPLIFIYIYRIHTVKVFFMNVCKNFNVLSKGILFGFVYYTFGSSVLQCMLIK